MIYRRVKFRTSRTAVGVTAATLVLAVAGPAPAQMHGSGDVPSELWRAYPIDPHGGGAPITADEQAPRDGAAPTAPKDDRVSTARPNEPGERGVTPNERPAAPRDAGPLIASALALLLLAIVVYGVFGPVRLPTRAGGDARGLRARWGDGRRGFRRRLDAVARLPHFPVSGRAFASLVHASWAGATAVARKGVGAAAAAPGAAWARTRPRVIPDPVRADHEVLREEGRGASVVEALVAAATFVAARAPEPADENPPASAETSDRGGAERAFALEPRSEVETLSDKARVGALDEVARVGRSDVEVLRRKGVAGKGSDAEMKRPAPRGAEADAEVLKEKLASKKRIGKKLTSPASPPPAGESAKAKTSRRSTRQSKRGGALAPSPAPPRPPLQPAPAVRAVGEARRTNGAEPAAEPFRPPGAECRIDWWRGYVSAQFVARMTDGDYEIVAKSPYFRWRKSGPPPEEAAALEAFETLLASLESDGWAPVAHGPEWFVVRLRRMSQPDRLALLQAQYWNRRKEKDVDDHRTT